MVGEDRRRRRYSRTHGAWLPEPPGPGRSSCCPCGKAKLLPQRLHRQLPCRLKDCASREEPLKLESCPPASTPQRHIYCSCSCWTLHTHIYSVFLSHNSELCPPTAVCELYIVSANTVYSTSCSIHKCFLCMCCCAMFVKKKNRIYNAGLVIVSCFYTNTIPQFCSVFYNVRRYSLLPHLLNVFGIKLDNLWPNCWCEQMKTELCFPLKTTLFGQNLNLNHTLGLKGKTCRRMHM